MTLFYLPIPITSERLRDLYRLVESPEFNIEIYLVGIPPENGQSVIDSLKEVIVQAILACDGAVNGSRN